MSYLKSNIKNTYEFLKDARAYFRDVLLAHGCILFILLPVLASLIRLILAEGHINYFSSDTIPIIITQHPIVLLTLLSVMLLIVLCAFFEFAFLLLSMYFIKIQQPIKLKELLRLTWTQLRKVKPSIILFFLFYFFLALPIGGINFNSDLLSKIKIPAFIIEFIFTMRFFAIGVAIIGFISLTYFAIRFIFVLPTMILKDIAFSEAIKESWKMTRKNFFSILGRFFFLGGLLLVITSSSFFLVIHIQGFIESTWPLFALISAVIAMTILQGVLLFQLVLSSVGFFFIVIDFMWEGGVLPEFSFTPSSKDFSKREKYSLVKTSVIFLSTVFFILGTLTYNKNFLQTATLKKPITVSHRGVSNGNGVQNTLESLRETTKIHPDFVEIDIQQTKDHEFIVYHDFDLKQLTGTKGSPSEFTLQELQQLTAKENGKKVKLASFDEYLAEAEKNNQKLLIEIKTMKKDSEEIVALFLKKYQEKIENNGDWVQSLNFQLIEEIKKQAPAITAGYILPFNFVGPPTSKADFLTMEYSTINQNFIDAAHSDKKQVFVWTVNDEDTLIRMMFYGVDGIVTDDMDALNQAIQDSQRPFTYSDQLIHFVIGVG